MMKYFVLVFIVISLFGCEQNGVPDDILPPEKMEVVLWDQIQADAFTLEFIAKDSSKNVIKENLALQQKIFAKNKTDKETFYKSYDYYLQHEKLMKPLLDSITAKQTALRDRIDLQQKLKAVK